MKIYKGVWSSDIVKELTSFMMPKYIERTMKSQMFIKGIEQLNAAQYSLDFLGESAAQCC